MNVGNEKTGDEDHKRRCYRPTENDKHTARCARPVISQTNIERDTNDSCRLRHNFKVIKSRTMEVLFVTFFKVARPFCSSRGTPSKDKLQHERPMRLLIPHSFASLSCYLAHANLRNPLYLFIAYYLFGFTCICYVDFSYLIANN